MNLPTVAEVQEVLLAWFWIISAKWRDRNPQTMLEHVNEITGLPERAEDLVPNYRAASGASLALQVTPTPGGLAASWLRYHADASIKCTSLADCDGCRELSQKPPAKRDAEEIAAINDLTYLIKLAVRDGARNGLFDERPADMDGQPMPLDADGMTMRFGVTVTGLERARQFCPGSKYEGMVRGWEQALTRSEFQKAPAWLRGGA